MAQYMEDRGLILALDINHARLVSLCESARRLGIGCIQPVMTDASGPVSNIFRNRFSGILVDAPCSALGVISRHPDAKWARREADIRRLAGLQKTILKRTAPLLREGGGMLYVVCTLSREENEDVVTGFLKENRGMVLENLRAKAPETLRELIDDQGFLRTWPHSHGMDGFFGAMFRRK
jgi:16S rRNA (cytosine967-C5)-methyltransferase